MTGSGPAVITGAGSGIGRATALAFARAGRPLGLLDRDADGLGRTAEACRGLGVPVETATADVTDGAALREALRELARRLGGLAVLVNNAGIGTEKPLLDHALDDFHRIFAVNLFGLFVALQEAARIMVEAGSGGSIVNMASVAGLRGSVGRAAYGSSKAAVINLTQVAAVELAPHGIRVNAVAPGPIETPLVAAMHGERTRAAWLRQVPLRRYGTPEEVAEAVLWLAGPQASYVSGQVLVVDGGFAAAGLLPA